MGTFQSQMTKREMRRRTPRGFDICMLSLPRKRIDSIRRFASAEMFAPPGALRIMGIALSTKSSIIMMAKEEIIARLAVKARESANGIGETAR